MQVHEPSSPQPLPPSSRRPAVASAAWVSLGDRLDFGGRTAPPEGRSHVGAAVNRAVADHRNTVPRSDAFPMGSLVSIWVNDGDAEDEALTEVTKLIAEARGEVCIQTYIFDASSEAGKGLLDAIAAKQREVPGFKARFVLSGGWPVDRGFTRALERHGVEADVAYYRHPLSRAANHTKSFVIDGHTAVVGGDNIDNSLERDLMVKVRGPVVDALLKDFDDAWRHSNRGKPPQHVRLPAPPSARPLVPMTMLGKVGNGYLGFHYRNAADQGLLAAMRAARHEIKIATPNCNDVEVWETLREVLSRQPAVRVSIMMPKDYNDAGAWFDRARNRDFLRFWAQLPAAAKANLEVRWHSEDGKTPLDNHTKYMSVDGVWAYVGSQNMDNQSFSYSRELGLGVDDAAEVQRLDAAVFDDYWARALKVEPGVLDAYLPLPSKSWTDLLVRYTGFKHLTGLFRS